jgi:hypothetical protein
MMHDRSEPLNLAAISIRLIFIEVDNHEVDGRITFQRSEHIGHERRTLAAQAVDVDHRRTYFDFGHIYHLPFLRSSEAMEPRRFIVKLARLFSGTAKRLSHFAFTQAANVIRKFGYTAREASTIRLTARSQSILST